MKDPGGVHAMYNTLAWYVQLENWRARRSRFADFSHHKTLDTGTAYVNEMLVEHAGLGPSPSVLDAGCGFGGTIFHLHAHLGGSYDGITMSAPQLRAARREARLRGTEGSCRFHRSCYDEPQGRTYDAVIAIESLIHARDLRHTLFNLGSAVAPGGRMALVEDMAAAPIDESFPAEAQLLREHWGCRRFPAVADYEANLRAAGLAITRRVDLTPHVRYRTVGELDRIGAAYASWFRRVPFAPVRRVLAAYLGGIALEKLYAMGAVRYQLLVAEKTASGTADAAACQDYSRPSIPR